MAVRAKRLCRKFGCAVRVSGGAYCEGHRPLERAGRRRADRGRPSARARGYDARWERFRKVWLARHPLCEEHLRAGQVVQGQVVDHITPFKGDERLKWDPENLQTLCKQCHNRKSATEPGGPFHRPGRAG